MIVSLSKWKNVSNRTVIFCSGSVSVLFFIDDLDKETGSVLRRCKK